MASQFIQEKNLIYEFLKLQASSKNQVHKNNPLSNLLVKINYFGHKDFLNPRVLLI